MSIAIIKEQTSIDLTEVRRLYGEQIRALAGLHGNPAAERVIEAFKTVSREDFAGVGPWQIMSPLSTGVFQTTNNAHPEHLYHSVLIALDRNAGINIGEPALWARLFADLDIPDGANILQIGSGSGYYSVILANIVGSSGYLTGFEMNATIAKIGSNAVDKIGNIKIRIGNGATDLRPTDGPFDVIVAFAGVTHPAKDWLDRLSDGGVMLLPVTGVYGWGAMCIFKKTASNRFSVQTIGSCGFYPCFGARSETLAVALDSIWEDRTKLNGWSVQMTYDANGILYEADGQVFSAPFAG